MCGFFGVVFPEEKNNIGEILYKAGERLSYRGYDTAGIAFFENNKYEIRKEKGSIEEVDRLLGFKGVKGYKGIIQLRWATFGEPKKENAQPHDDCSGRFVGAHNGNIVNTVSLRKMLIDRGHKLKGENDGEIILHIIEEMISGGASTMPEAIESADKLIKGDYAYVITDLNDKYRMYAVKKGSSMFAGVAEEYICVSSDLTAVLDHTDRIIMIEDGEYIEFTPNEYVIRKLSGEIIDRKPQKIDISIDDVHKGNYPHFMIKEIKESPSRVKELIDIMPDHEGYKKAIDLLGGTEGSVFLIGSGSSYNALSIGAYYLSDISGINVDTFYASGFSRRYGNVIKDKDILFAVSQSGETKDVKNTIKFFKEKTNGKIIGLYNMIGSSLAYMSDIVLPTVCDIEISVPATKTFINQVVSFLFLSYKIGNKNDTTEIEKIPSYLEKTLKREEEIKKWADIIKNYSSVSFLGYGIMHPVVMEGSLKLKETAYIYAEPMFSGEFKHGPLAIIDEGYPVIFVSTGDGEDKSMIISHISEVKTRKGKIFTISSYDDDIVAMSDYFIQLPDVPYHIKPIVSAYMLQILSYWVGVGKGIDPDRPRNISKTITVD